MARFFLSHASLDKDVVRRVAQRLEENGAEIWLDEQKIDVGDNFVQSIEKAIRECEYILIFISENSIDKPWVEFEIEKALEQTKDAVTTLIPIMIDKTDVPVPLKHVVHIDISENFDAGIDKLMSAVTSVDIKTMAISENLSLAWARRKHADQSKRVASLIWSAPGFTAVYMFRVAGHLASAVSIRASLVNFWQYYWIELFGENNGTFKLSKSELDYMITISDKVVREAKKEIGVVAEDVGVAIAFAVRTRNHFGVRCAGGIGALHSQKINANGDRAILNIGHYGRFESRVPTHLWSLAHISDHPIGFAFRFVNDEQKDRRFPDLFQLNSKGDLFSLHSYYIHPESAEYEKFIQVCVNDDDGAMVARRICQFGKPVTDECSSIVVWVH